MKTAEIKDLLKKELLIIELPEGNELAGVTNGAIYYYDNQMNYEDYPLSILIDGYYTLLGKPDEIKESDARELVGEGFNISTNKKVYNDYKDDCNCFKSALESFFSALESEIYWDVNPFGEESRSYSEVMDGVSNDEIYEDVKDWHEAQEKTFDRNRSIIFVKN